MEKGLEIYVSFVTVVIVGFALYCEFYKPHLCYEESVEKKTVQITISESNLRVMCKSLEK